MSHDAKHKGKERIPETAPLTPAETEVYAPTPRTTPAPSFPSSHPHLSLPPSSSAQIMDAMKSTYTTRLATIPENTLVRYVRGYKDDPHPKEKALEMLGKMLTWRETEKVDALATETLPKADVFKRIWPSGLHGHGKDGHPILINRVGAVDGSKLTKEFSMDDVTKFHIQEMEALDRYKEAASKAQGRRVYKHIAVLDLKGLGMSHLSSKFTDPMKKFIHIDQDNYPETLFVMIVVNAGMLLKTAWKIVSKFIDPITKERIKFGNDALTEYIDAGNIPKIYGGACKCAGGKCLEVPFEEGDKTAKVEIAAGEKVAVE